MRIQHNILAMNAYRNYNNNTSALGKNLEKLSSGYKINRAGDDAAGLAISEKMRAQITGLNAAQKNVKDGISLVKTAEGAMQEIQDMLNRMDYLATQSANGTYDNEVDRLNLQKEVTALQDEINRIADSANFNGIKLLNGDMAIKDTTAGVAGGEFLDGVDGTAPAAAGAASVTFKLGTAASNNKDAGALSTAPADTFDAVGFNGNATKTKIEFTTGTIANSEKALGVELQDGTGTKAAVSTLGTAAFNGKTIADYFDLEIGGTAKKWEDLTAADTFADNTKYTLVAKNAGDLGTTVSGAIDALVAAGANNTNVTPTATHGVDNTAATPAPATNAKHEFEVDVSKLEGGQIYEFAGKTFEVVTDGGAASGTNTAISINLTDTAANKAKAVLDAIKTANPADYTFDTAVTAKAGDATGNVFTFKAEGAAPDTASAGAFRQGEGNVKNAITGTYTAGTAAGTGGATGFAQATWKDIDINGLSAGAKVEITSLGQKYTVEVVDTGAKGGQINKADITDGDKWTEAFQRAGFAAGTIDFTVTDGKATAVVTGTTYDNAVDAGKGNKLITAVSVTDNKPTEVTLADKKFEMGTTTVSELETLYADKYDVVVKDADGTAKTGDVTVNSGYTVELKAKVKGKITDDALDDMKKIGAGAPTGTEVIASYAGHDEGTDTTGHNTKYTVTFDPTKIAGGQAFTFGNVDGKSYTFELSLDSEGTGNGNTGADENVTGKDANRIQIDLSGVAQADYVKTIKDEVADKMGANFDVTFSGNTVTAVAKDSLKADGNLGAARYSAQGGGITGVTYDPYLEKSGGAEGTYAEVTYSFDSSKLAEGDKLTIGKDGTGAGAISLTIAKETDLKNNKISLDDAQNDAKLIAAIEQKNAALGSGKQIGQVKIANGKLTITDNVTNTKAADFKNGRGFFSITSAEREKTDKGGLTLQIGDTSDEFNQMRVEIGDMHVSAMGTFKKDADGKLTKELESSIQDIDIGTQEGAQKAVDVIKNAINYVSGIRGDLGAYQNRLEHTQNNLSVMAENIQDAESTIRDTDVAEEMMSYVKNNILVQSAQAMLAQANQVPQGVLQLLG